MARTLADQPRLPRSLRKRKQGIVLLMVVSLLALFLLMGVTFAVLAMQYNSASRMHAAHERYGDDPMMELDLAFGQALYGTQTNGSLQGQEMLRDLYGTDSLTANVGSLNNDTNKTCGNQFTVIQLTRTAAMSAAPGFYNGRVLTFISGNAAGLSTRVAGYEPDIGGGTAEIYIEAVKGEGSTIITPSNGDDFVVNGQPFNGYGFGYDPYSLQVDAVDATTTQQVLLMPHYAGYTTRYATTNSPISPGAQFTPDAGGADEPYDVPDYNNMHMALVPPGMFAAPGTLPLLPSWHRPELVHYWLNHWPGGGSPTLKNDANQRDFARQVIFRPMPWDHHNFTGSNPSMTAPSFSTATDADYLTLIQRLAQQGGWSPYVWDVDNDSDGVKDSIWVDVGLPVMTSANGRRYKRLFAYLIKDLDGRANVNVHGNRAQQDATNRTQTPLNHPFPVFVAPTPNVGFPLLGGTSSTSLYLPRGMGFGPAEVDLQIVLDVGGATGKLANLMAAGPWGRYGTDGYPGMQATDDPLSVVKFSGIPNNYVQVAPPAAPPAWQFTAPGSWYSSPPDVWGRGAIAVDFGGRPMHFRMATTGETTDDPYEMEWESTQARNDSPYSVNDMEKLLRFHDPDTQVLPSRLVNAVSELATGPGQPDLNAARYERLRNSLTTMSSNVPVPLAIPSFQDRTDMRTALVNLTGGTQATASQTMITAANAPTVLGLYALRLTAGGVTPANVPAELKKIFPFEFWQGTKLNPNRFVGNGINDNVAGTPPDNVHQVVDEPAESQTINPLELAWGDNGTNRAPSGGNLPTGFASQRAFPVNGVDADGNGTPDLSAASADIQYARQLLARHLYCLMLAIKDPAFNSPNLEAAVATSNEATTRQIAQWAINVVDFRDPDAIMTAFEYDVNPWNGWNVDGNPATTSDGPDRRVVWGCEYPELLITETKAFHNRRVKDSKFDTSMKERGETTDPDLDVDQFRVPQGSLFFEMLCTRSHTQYNMTGGQESMYNSQLPWELYDRQTGKLALDRVAPGGNPVWQVAVARLAANNNESQYFPAERVQNRNQWDSTLYTDPTDPAVMTQTSYPIYSNIAATNGGALDQVNIERYVWFTPTDGGGSKRDRIFHNQKNWNAKVSPGQYVVVGPREETVVSSVRDPAAPGGWGGDSSQKIQLSNTTGVTITNNNGATTTYNPGTQTQPVVAIVADTRAPDAWTNAAAVNRRVGLNITEPLTQGMTYYDEYNVSNDARMPVDAYHDPSLMDPTLIDEPFDSRPGRPLEQATMVKTGTYSNRSAVFLQRLADPTKAWDVLSNPYITIDFASIDVTVYSGEEDTDRQVMVGMPPMPEDVDPSDPSSMTDPMRLVPQFGSEQRGNEEPANTANSNPWLPYFTNKANNTPDAGLPATPPYMRHSLRHTFGFINEPIGVPRSDKGQPYLGDPAGRPFPWLTWLNRPYVNSAELLLVPLSPPGRLLMDMSPDHPAVPQTGTFNPYQISTAQTYRAPFVQLLNFLHSSITPGQSGNYSRLFDYIDTPSNFVGVEKFYSPSAVANDGLAPYAPYVPPFLYRPPFNRMSKFRDPGRININTIFDFDRSTGSLRSPTWEAIQGIDTTAGTNLQNQRATAGSIFSSRQGFNGDAAGTNIGTMDANHPTLFANPFRPANSADLMPNIGNMRKTPVEATLLRSGGTANKPLLANQSANASLADADDPDRNAYFRYQGLQKVSNIVGTQSNCYAVWITVGYFEVEENPAGIDAAHPDGFMLGQELGIDTGEVQRHRSFYLIDRSIPVGFIPGLKLNTDNCVLLRRQID
ncbi:hypothetical protein NA78x_005557 [Anatilimnocola sp. NA78]|uniref:hypothetical protein n=1 Tax=Anatilimnocola sp. NA78 TaxID=3415683 RepID=UPI003CE4F328